MIETFRTFSTTRTLRFKADGKFLVERGSIVVLLYDYPIVSRESTQFAATFMTYLFLLPNGAIATRWMTVGHELEGMEELR